MTWKLTSYTGKNPTDNPWGNDNRIPIRSFTMKKPMILAAGTQSGGTTLVSWCFLQHPALDGELDMASDRIQVMLDRVQTPWTWVKMTHYGFRWHEVAEIYELYGYDVKPLLIVRNPFQSYASLKHKWYGRNSVTAEDPPLITRFRRFYEDWLHFKDKGYPIIQFEQFLENPEQELRSTCAQLGLEFSHDMLTWPKNSHEISYINEMNHTFEMSLTTGKGFGKEMATKEYSLDECEVEWIQREMAEMLAQYEYCPPETIGVDCHIRPEPFDSRRYIGFGSNPRFTPISRYIDNIVTALRDESYINVYIYGASDIGSYILKRLNEHGIKVSGFIDRHADQYNRQYEKLPVSPIPELDFTPADTIIIASLNSAHEIVKTIEAIPVSGRPKYHSPLHI